jgi:DNA-binding MarR family transcriptional regulator
MGLFHDKFLRNCKHQDKGPTELKKNHIKILHVLYENDKLTQTKIGKMLDIEKGSLTVLVDQLEEKGLVKRCEDPEDRRKYLIALTDEGKNVIDKNIDHFLRKVNQLFDNIEPEETRKFIDSLQFVVNFMKKV